MITGHDRPDRRDQPVLRTDCLAELATDWLQQPLTDMPDAARGRAVEGMCLLISQMRHREPKTMDIERRRWVERVAVRLCAQVPGMKGFEGAVRMQLEHRITVAMLTYHDWRERYAPKFGEPAATGPSDSGEVTA